MLQAAEAVLDGSIGAFCQAGEPHLHLHEPIRAIISHELRDEVIFRKTYIFTPIANRSTSMRMCVFCERLFPYFVELYDASKVKKTVPGGGQSTVS